MADREIEIWNNKGSLSLWHYEGFPRDYCGYHLSADRVGAEFLVGLIERFRSARYPARKVVALDVPSQEVLSVPNCATKCINAQQVEFCFRIENPEDHWSISDSDGSVKIEMGARGLDALERGAGDMLLGNGDWSTGTGNQALWFWWRVRSD